MDPSSFITGNSWNYQFSYFVLFVLYTVGIYTSLVRSRCKIIFFFFLTPEYICAFEILWIHVFMSYFIITGINLLSSLRVWSYTTPQFVSFRFSEFCAFVSLYLLVWLSIYVFVCLIVFLFLFCTLLRSYGQFAPVFSLFLQIHMNRLILIVYQYMFLFA